jgi:hypothetical protein
MSSNEIVEVRKPRWLRASMTLEAAAKECGIRGFSLKARWSATMGLDIIAVRPRRKGEDT